MTTVSQTANRNWGALDRAPAAAAFVGAASLVLLYALRGGGSYDLVVFEENGLVIWWILALGVSLGLLPRGRPSRGSLMLLAALAAYAAWTALSLLWTDSYELTFAEVARVLDYLGLIALVALALDRETWLPAAAGLGFGAFVVCAVAVGSRLAPAVFGHDQVDALLHTDRLSIPFGYWNSVGAWGAMCTAIGLAWSAHDRSRVRRAVALGFVPVAALTTYLTYSRAGVVDAAVGVIVVLVISRNRVTAVVHAAVAAAGVGLTVAAVRGSSQIAHATGTAGASTVLGGLAIASGACAVVATLTRAGGVDRLRAPRRIFRGVALVSSLVLIVVAVILGPPLVSKAWDSFTGATAGHTTLKRQGTDNPTARLTNLAGSRYPLWKSVLQAFDTHPLHGIGAGTTEFWWNEHATGGEFVRDAHSIWLQNMEELGAPGLLLIVIVVVSALGLGVAVRRRVRRAASAGGAAAFVAALTVYLLSASVDWMWESTAVTVLAFAGIAVLGARLGGTTLRLSVPVRVLLAVGALGLGAVQLPGLLSTAAIRRSQTAELAGRADLALAWARNAVGAEPWSASAYQQEGLVLESAGQLRAAAAKLLQAISREPQNYRHWLVLARIETERGRLGPAVVDYDRARQLSPRAIIFALGRP